MQWEQAGGSRTAGQGQPDGSSRERPRPRDAEGQTDRKRQDRGTALPGAGTGWHRDGNTGLGLTGGQRLRRGVGRGNGQDGSSGTDGHGHAQRTEGQGTAGQGLAQFRPLGAQQSIPKSSRNSHRAHPPRTSASGCPRLHRGFEPTKGLAKARRRDPALALPPPQSCLPPRGIERPLNNLVGEISVTLPAEEGSRAALPAPAPSPWGAAGQRRRGNGATRDGKAGGGAGSRGGMTATARGDTRTPGGEDGQSHGAGAGLQLGAAGLSPGAWHGGFSLPVLPAAPRGGVPQLLVGATVPSPAGTSLGASPQHSPAPPELLSLPTSPLEVPTCTRLA